MHRSDNTTISFISGLLGGVLFKIQFLNIGTSGTMITKLIESGIIAFVCGIAGVIGKECYVFVKKKIKKK